MERDEILAWRARWEEVRAVTDAEARSASRETRLRALARLHAFGRDRAPAWPDEKLPIWERFQRLRTIYRDRRAGR